MNPMVFGGIVVFLVILVFTAKSKAYGGYVKGGFVCVVVAALVGVGAYHWGQKDLEKHVATVFFDGEKDDLQKMRNRFKWCQSGQSCDWMRGETNTEFASAWDAAGKNLAKKPDPFGSNIIDDALNGLEEPN